MVFKDAFLGVCDPLTGHLGTHTLNLPRQCDSQEVYQSQSPLAAGHRGSERSEAGSYTPSVLVLSLTVSNQKKQHWATGFQNFNRKSHAMPYSRTQLQGLSEAR